MTKSYIDNLTGIFNFEYLIDHYHQIIKNEYEKYSVVIADFKNFKYINDNFGHIVGDKALVLFVKCAKQVFDKDLIIRRSGDEFVILTDNNYQEIVKKIDLLHQKINQAVKKKEVPMAFSFNSGVNQAGKDFDLTIEKADLAMYQAKYQKQRVVQFEEKHYQIAKAKEAYLSDVDHMLEYNQLTIEKQAIFDINYNYQNIYEIYIKDSYKKSIFNGKYIDVLRKSFRVKRMEMQAIEHIMSQNLEKDTYIMINLDTQTLLNYQFDFVETINMLAKKNKKKKSNIIFCIDIANYEGEIDNLTKEMRKLKKANFKLAIQGIDFSKRMVVIPIVSNIQIDYVKIPLSLIKKNIVNERKKTVMKYMIKLIEDLNIMPIFANISNEQELAIVKMINPRALVKGYLFAAEETIK